MPQFIREVPPLPPEDERLVSAYTQLGRPVDDLPYTAEFEEMVHSLREHGDQRDESEVLRRLLRLRKAARLPRLGRLTSPTLRAAPEDVELVERLLREELGTLGSRDQLPYTERFDRLLHRYNSQAMVPLDKHHFWRLIARVSK
jgi:hypothetical protein